MKYLVVSCILFCTLQTFSQQDYFIYLQTDNNQPFYIRINNNVYSSSASGYVILSNLADSASVITIGFAKNVFAEQQFIIPANHKDAGYVLKYNGDKGWGLYNLQSAAIIMSSSMPEEKKKSELSGVRRMDAFSQLLASAVNDTAVLYTVTRPPKPVPAVAEEKKRDTVAVAMKEVPQKDSLRLVRISPEKTDSSATVENGLPLKTDTGITAGAHTPKTNQPAFTKTRRPVHDTATVVRNTVPPAVLNPKTSGHAKDSTTTAKAATRQKRDSIIATGKLAAKGQSVIAKNKNERKDTIIIMSGRKPDNGKTVIKTSVAKKEPLHADTGKDSLVLVKKDILHAPEEKRDALLNNNDAAGVQKVVTKKDSLIDTGAKKDTAEILIKNKPVQPADPKTDTAIIAVKRLRPLITKAAELLTDTSYIAVFVDESKEKFDTIRISIPFNETATRFVPNKPLPKQPDTTVAEIKKHSFTFAITHAAAAAASNDTIAASTVKDSAAFFVKRQNIPPAVKKDSAFTEKATDSTAVISQQNIAPAVKKNNAERTVPKDSVPVMDSREMQIAKKDSVPVPVMAADSASAAKAPVRAPFFNSDCREVAVYSDIDKLRIKMLMVTTDDDRIGLAKKLFKQKCLLVHQVRALSELFKSDEGKYKWFDAVYPFVSDTGIFSSLGDLIKDDYYLTRFKAMLRH